MQSISSDEGRGIDVESEHFVGEVKHHADPVSPGIVRQIVGVASIEGKIPLVFSLNGYSEAALQVGRRSGAGLFTYSFEEGTLRASSPQAERALKLGLLSLTTQTAQRGSSAEPKDPIEIYGPSANLSGSPGPDEEDAHDHLQKAIDLQANSCSPPALDGRAELMPKARFDTWASLNISWKR